MYRKDSLPQLAFENVYLSFGPHGLGRLAHQKHLNLNSCETAEPISENPYLQYFLRLMKYDDNTTGFGSVAVGG